MDLNLQKTLENLDLSLRNLKDIKLYEIKEYLTKSLMHARIYKINSKFFGSEYQINDLNSDVVKSIEEDRSQYESLEKNITTLSENRVIEILLVALDIADIVKTTENSDVWNNLYSQINFEIANTYIEFALQDEKGIEPLYKALEYYTRAKKCKNIREFYLDEHILHSKLFIGKRQLLISNVQKSIDIILELEIVVEKCLNNDNNNSLDLSNFHKSVLNPFKMIKEEFISKFTDILDKNGNFLDQSSSDNNENKDINKPNIKRHYTRDLSQLRFLIEMYKGMINASGKISGVKTKLDLAEQLLSILINPIFDDNTSEEKALHQITNSKKYWFYVEYQACHHSNIAFLNDLRLSLGNAFLKLGNTEKAIEYYLKILTEKSINKLTHIVDANLGKAYLCNLKEKEIDKLQKSIFHLLRALESKKLSSEQKFDVLTDLGRAHYQAAQVPQAISFYQRSIDEYDKFKKEFKVKFQNTKTSIHINLGMLFLENKENSRACNIESAIYHFETALNSKTNLSRKEFSLSYFNLGNSYLERSMGDIKENIDKAIDCYVNIIDKLDPEEIHEDKLIPIKYLSDNYGNHYAELPDDPDFFLLSTLLAKTYLSLGNSYFVENSLEVVENNLEKSSKENLVEDSLISYEIALEKLNELKKAYSSSLFHKDTNQLNSIDYLISTVHLNLGNLEFIEEHYTEAENNFSEALMCLENLKQKIQQSDIKNEQLLVENVQNSIATAQTNLGRICLKYEKYDHAIKHFEKSIKIANNAFNLLTAVEYYLNLVSIETNKYRNLKTVISKLEFHRHFIKSIYYSDTYIYDAMLNACTEQLKQINAPENILEDLFLTIEHLNNRKLTEIFEKDKQGSILSADIVKTKRGKEILTKIENLETDIIDVLKIKAKLDQNETKDRLYSLQKDLSVNLKELVECEPQLKERIEGTVSQVATLDSITDYCIKNDAAFLQYFLDSKKLIIICVTQCSVEHFIENNHIEINKLLDDLSNCENLSSQFILSTNRSFKRKIFNELNILCSNLSLKLISPMINCLQEKNIRRLFFSAQNPLDNLPINLLSIIEENSQSLLIDKFDLAKAPVLKIYKNPHSFAINKIAVLGVYTYNDDYQNLDWVANEIKNIKNIDKLNTDVLENHEVTEKTLYNIISNDNLPYDIIHISCHGEIDDITSTASLIFNSGQENCYLPIQQMYYRSPSLSSQSGLVVLALCYGGRTIKIDSELITISGFVPLFFSLGATACIASITALDDEYSSEFFNEYYKRLYNIDVIKGLHFIDRLAIFTELQRDLKKESKDWAFIEYHGLP